MKRKKSKPNQTGVAADAAARRGRRLLVNGSPWVWKIGRGGGVVAYGPRGQRECAHASIIKDINPDAFCRGQRKGSSDGMLTPKEVTAWITLLIKP